MTENLVGRAADPTAGYPRPQLRRDGWIDLNGPWEFALDRGQGWTRPDQVTWSDTRIVVPFSPETEASGIGEQGLIAGCWYKRTLPFPKLGEGHRLILHFGAVDYEATVWVDSCVVKRNQGGYVPFHVDITDFVGSAGNHTICVWAQDDPLDLAKPRGKQDWKSEPHSIWYPRTTGIWQTVWLEVVPRTFIESVRFRSSLERWEITFEARLAGDLRRPLKLEIELRANGGILARDSYQITGAELGRAILLSDPGIDDSRNELLWNPGHPCLIQVEMAVVTPDGKEVDRVQSYTALRSISVRGDRVLLNGRPMPMRLVLDQGYWPKTGLTPPHDVALRQDVELAKAMGFNGVRKHQKIEDPRYLYWADVLGLLVWEEMPSAYRHTKSSIERLTNEWLRVLSRDESHPCIVAWVPINESWGVPNLPESPAERDYVRALYHLTKTLDPTRPVVGNDGWESVATDIIGIHDYDPNPERIGRRYHAEQVLPRLFQRERPAGRLLVLEPHLSDVPIVLSEFGGIALGGERTWGYTKCASGSELARRYAALLEAVHSLGILSGFCYTQFADTYQEANGLLFADRTPKFPLEEIARATHGSTARERLLTEVFAAHDDAAPHPHDGST